MWVSEAARTAFISMCSLAIYILRVQVDPAMGWYLVRKPTSEIVRIPPFAFVSCQCFIRRSVSQMFEVNITDTFCLDENSIGSYGDDNGGESANAKCEPVAEDEPTSLAHSGVVLHPLLGPFHMGDSRLRCMLFCLLAVVVVLTSFSPQCRIRICSAMR